MSQIIVRINEEKETQRREGNKWVDLSLGMATYISLSGVY